jgi:hypothetical protein
VSEACGRLGTCEKALDALWPLATTGSRIAAEDEMTFEGGSKTGAVDAIFCWFRLKRFAKTQLGDGFSPESWGISKTTAGKDSSIAGVVRGKIREVVSI